MDFSARPENLCPGINGTGPGAALPLVLRGLRVLSFAAANDRVPADVSDHGGGRNAGSTLRFTGCSFAGSGRRLPHTGAALDRRKPHVGSGRLHLYAESRSADDRVREALAVAGMARLASHGVGIPGL